MAYLQLSREARRIFTQLQEQGKLRPASSIFCRPLPQGDWWKIISQAAKTSSHQFEEAFIQLSKARESDPTIPATWPDGMYETTDVLPSISEEEALAILHRFLSAEQKSLAPGIFLYLLQWDALAATYCPLQERYRILKKFVGDGLLLEAAATEEEKKSQLRWPLTITAKATSAIKTARLKARLSRFAPLEHFLSAVNELFPQSLRIIVWLVTGIGTGVGLTKLFKFLKSFF
jgi:hypothetical protein